MSGYGRGIPNNAQQQVQQANYSQFPNQQQQNLGRPKSGFVPPSTGGSGQRDEWDSFFSQETNVKSGNNYPQNVPHQQQQAGGIGQNAGNVYQQRQQSLATGNQPSNIPNPIDRANQLLRNLHQSSGPAPVVDSFSPSPYNQQSAVVQQQVHVQSGYDQRQQQHRLGPGSVGQNINGAPHQQQQQQMRQQQPQQFPQQGIHQQQPVQQQYNYASQQQQGDPRDARNVVPAEYGRPLQQQGQSHGQAPQFVIQQQKQPVRIGQIPVQQGGVQYAPAAVEQQQFQQPQQQQQQAYSAYGPPQQQVQLGNSGNVNITTSYQQAGAPVILTGAAPDVSRNGLNIAPQVVSQQQLGYQQQQNYVPIQQQQPTPQQQQIQIQHVLQNLPALAMRPGAAARKSRFSGGQQQSSYDNTAPVASGGKRPFQQQQGGSGSGGFPNNKYSRTDGNNNATSTLNRSSNFNSNARTGTNIGSASSNFQQRNDGGNKRANYSVNASVSVTNKQQSSGGRDRSSERGSASGGGGASRRIQKRVQPASGSGVTTILDRRRSRSPSRERRRERVPTGGTSGSGGGGGSGKTHDSFITSVAASHAYSSRRIDYAKLIFPNMLDYYNVPIISRHAHALSSPDLFSRFPKLYVPADFVRMEMDWNAMVESLQSDMIRHVYVTANAEIISQPGVVEEGSAAATALVSATTEPPRFTNITPSDDQTSTMFSCSSRIVFTAPKPVKFNARVLITFGMNNSETERIDFTLSKKLRVLIGRRKQNAILLGGSWSRELDGGDPLIDRNCLINTARRFVLAQSMVDINMFTRYVKMCEIIYQRPKEEIKGKFYPEQEEITVVYLCTVQSNLDMTEEEFSALWDHYSARVDGKEIGPIVNCDANTSATALLTPVPVVEVVEEEKPVAVLEGAVSSKDVSANDTADTQPQSVVENKPNVESIVGSTSDETAATSSVSMVDDCVAPSETTEGKVAEEATAVADLSSSPPVAAASETSVTDDSITAELSGAAAKLVVEENTITLSPLLSLEEETMKVEDKDDTTTAGATSVANVSGSHPIPKRDRSQSTTTAPTDVSATTATSAAVPFATQSAVVVSTKTHLIKPNKPCALICPMPITKEVASDFTRKQEGVSVKLLTLGQILTYSEDDSNERIFEASIAGELLRSLVAIDYADIITDFVMSEYSSQSSSYSGDPRIYTAVKTLRELSKQASIKAAAATAAAKAIKEQKEAATNGMNIVDTAATSSNATTADDGDVEMEVSGGVDVDTADTNTTNDVTESKSSGDNEAISETVATPVSDMPVDGIDATATTTSTAENTNISDVVDIAATVAVLTAGEEEHVAVVSMSASGGDDVEHTSKTTADDERMRQEHDGDDSSNKDDEEQQKLMTESDAKEWRRYFLNACRWFDTDQQRLLRHDHLELIMYSSTRDISLAELGAASWSVCKDEILRYEIHF